MRNTLKVRLINLASEKFVSLFIRETYCHITLYFILIESYLYFGAKPNASLNAISALTRKLMCCALDSLNVAKTMRYP